MPRHSSQIQPRVKGPSSCLRSISVPPLPVTLLRRQSLRKTAFYGDSPEGHYSLTSSVLSILETLSSDSKDLALHALQTETLPDLSIQPRRRQRLPCPPCYADRCFMVGDYAFARSQSGLSPMARDIVNHVRAIAKDPARCLHHLVLTIV